MPHSPRSRWRPVKVVSGTTEGRAARCFACERYYQVPLQPRKLVKLEESISISGVELKPGWYCAECLARARHSG